VAEINRYRTASGLGAVTDQRAWDVGLRHHLTYLEKTPPQYFTGQYRSLHTENPASPYYTPGGAREAGQSDLDEGGAHSPVEAIDLWLAAPFHAIGMLRPQLTQVALADDARTGFAALDVIRGLDYNVPQATAPIVFPGPGITTDLLTFGGESPSPLETCGWSSRSSVGLPLILLLPQPPSESITATLTGPTGLESSGDGTLCVVDEYDYHSSDPIYGPTGASILKGDNAVLLIPRRPLRPGAYSVDVEQSGLAATTWSFAAQAPIVRTSIQSIHVVGHSIRVDIATPTGTNIRCALSPRIGRVFERPRFGRCSTITVYRHVRSGTYRFSVESAAGNGSREVRVS
jgi:hypothetical protein